MIDARDTLERLIRERGEDYASLSRLLGRNAAYVQQFIRRGVPKKLDEDDRATLARYFGVDESLLGGPAASRGAGGLIAIPRVAVRASAGPGSFTDGERQAGVFGVDPAWLRRMGVRAGDLSAIRVDGDSMEPTLADGDDIVVDSGDAAARLRDGIYVLRIDGVLNVKRIALGPGGCGVTVKSDNPAWPSWPDVDRASLDVIGRVIWVGRRL